MRSIEHIYVDGKFVVPDGNERLDLFNPATEEKIGDVRLGNADDARAAVAAAKRAFPAMANPPRRSVSICCAACAIRSQSDRMSSRRS